MKKVFVVYDGTRYETGPPEEVFDSVEKAEGWIKNNPTANWKIKELELK